MKKRIIAALVTFALLIPLTAPAVYAGDLLMSKAVYYTDESDYMDGDCILTATRMMIRRSAGFIFRLLSYRATSLPVSAER